MFPALWDPDPNKINDRGQIVGIYSTITNGTTRSQHGLSLGRRRLHHRSMSPALPARLRDIDNHGRIVGEYLDAAGIFHGFLRDPGGTFTTIDVPGATRRRSSASTMRAR